MRASLVDRPQQSAGSVPTQHLAELARHAGGPPLATNPGLPVSVLRRLPHDPVFRSD
jgi:hypothetical protein